MRKEEQLSQDFSDIKEYIHTTIDGTFRKRDLGIGGDDINFRRNDASFVLRNVATGLKSFGIIDILLQHNRLNDKTLLVIDEPEVHLHPRMENKNGRAYGNVSRKGCANYSNLSRLLFCKRDRILFRKKKLWY